MNIQLGAGRHDIVLDLNESSIPQGLYFLKIYIVGTGTFLTQSILK